jgi:hypothetical protein
LPGVFQAQHSHGIIQSCRRYRFDPLFLFALFYRSRLFFEFMYLPQEQIKASELKLLGVLLATRSSTSFFARAAWKLDKLLQQKLAMGPPRCS